MKIAQWLNTARIVGILYAMFVLSLGSLIYIETRTLMNNWDLFITGVKLGVWRQYSIRGILSRRVAEVMYWAPRITWVLISLFIALIGILFFADSSTTMDNFWTEIPLLAIFLYPAIIMGMILAAAWFWEWVGSAIILLVTIFLLFQIPNNSFTLMLQWMVLYIVPLFLFATVFWLNWRWHKEIRVARDNSFVPAAETRS